MEWITIAKQDSNSLVEMFCFKKQACKIFLLSIFFLQEIGSTGSPSSSELCFDLPLDRSKSVPDSQRLPRVPRLELGVPMMCRKYLA